ncbi:MAG TPA: hypothetical protein VEW71_02920 [Allosphingosinicella sp.]|nr:hypothetical protein [Allosphingosinicella sp.]
MRGIAAAFAASVAMAGCAEEAAAPAGNQASAEAAGSKASGAVADSPEVLANTTVTASDQPLKVPPAPVELLVTQVSLSSTGTIPRHKHPWSRYVYLQSGTLRVTNYDAETVNTYNAPQIIVESIDQWHDAMVVANAPVQMIVVDQVPPGQSNVIFPPPSR